MQALLAACWSGRVGGESRDASVRVAAKLQDAKNGTSKSVRKEGLQGNISSPWNLNHQTGITDSQRKKAFEFRTGILSPAKQLTDYYRSYPLRHDADSKSCRVSGSTRNRRTSHYDDCESTKARRLPLGFCR
jgi:hypothetical protein